MATLSALADASVKEAMQQAAKPSTLLKDGPVVKAKSQPSQSIYILDDEAAKLWEESLCTSLPSISSASKAKVTICDLRILSPETMEPLIYPVDKITEEHTKTPLYTIKQGCLFSMGFSWRVAGAPIVGFRCLIQVYRLGIPVYKGKVFLGTFLPRDEPYVYFVSEECAPKGVLSKGNFRAKFSFCDEKNTTFKELEYVFAFSEEWS